MQKHIVQSKEWGEFKSNYGTKAVEAGRIQYTLHKLPYLKAYYAYAPKVNPEDINWEDLEKSLIENNCFVINFDAPHVLINTKREKSALEIFNKHKCIKSNKNTFTKYNILLDINKTEDEILSNMHSKHRYNIRYAKRKKVTTRQGSTKKDFEIFYKLLDDTAKRQKYLIHPKSYYEGIWEQLGQKGLAHILIAEYKNTPLASWLLFTYDKKLYYPYGGSSTEHRNLHASNLIGFEAIKLGIKSGCEVFDMWGACKDLDNKDDPEWGFTNFKLKFGGEYVEYIDSYDYVLNKNLYFAFSFAYPKIMCILKKLK